MFQSQFATIYICKYGKLTSVPCGPFKGPITNLKDKYLALFSHSMLRSNILGQFDKLSKTFQAASSTDHHSPTASSAAITTVNGCFDHND